MLFIIGMPGVGKTYWGSRVAEATDSKFVDLDIYIEEQEQTTIKALFENLGEDGFRKKEHQYLEKVINLFPGQTVIASGGGTPCFHQNISIMKQAGKVIYLQAEVSHLISNIKKEPDVRPLLIGRENLSGYLLGLLLERKAYYEQAQHILQTDNISLANFTQILR